MAASLDGQGCGDEGDRILPRQPDAEVIILADGKVLIKPADVLKDLPPEETRRQAQKTQCQDFIKDPSGILLVFLAGVEMFPAPDPDFLGGTDFGPGESPEKGQLNSDLFLFPKVIRIEEGDEISSGKGEALVAGCAYASMSLKMIGGQSAEGLHNLPGVVLRAVINHQELEGMIRTGPAETILIER
jgi:hypothetical protein